MDRSEAGNPGLPAAVLSWLSLLLFGLAGLGVGFMALATSYDVLARYGFNRPTVWATELSTYVLAATIFLGAAHTHLTGGHVRVDVALNAVSPVRQRQLKLLAGWLAMIVVSIMAWRMALLVLSDYRTGARLFSLLLTPAWMPKLPIAIGLVVLAGAVLTEIARDSRGRGGWLPFLLFGAVVAPLLVWFGPRPPELPGIRLDYGTLAIVGAALLGAGLTGGVPVLAGLAVLVAVGSAGLGFAATLGIGWVMAVFVLLIAGTLALGVRIAYALAFIGICGVYVLTPVPFPATVAERAWNSVNSFALTAVPMYVLMGAILVRSGLSRELFAVMARLLSRLPGGLAHAGIAGCAVFSAVSGSSVATAATMGTVACPEMTSRGYSPRLAYGSIAAGGTLGILIPPSVPLIIYGITVGVPVTQLFMAGILPGLLLVSIFLLLILAWSLLDPTLAPRHTGAPQVPLTRASVIDTCIVLGLIAMIVFSLYGGVATPSEIGAVGAVLALLASLARGRMRGRALADAIRETVVVTSFIFLIVVGANILTFSFDFLRISERLMAAVGQAEFNRWLVLGIILLIFLVLGMFLDSISMLVLTLPVIFPLSQQLGFDPIWFAIVLVIMAEIGLITPPVGMNLFVLQGIGRNVAMRTIALGTLPFIGAMLLTVLLLCLFPGIALLLTR